MNDAIDTVLGRLEGKRKSGKNKWMARCPAHEDKRPSLSVSEGRDGRVLLHDFGGCTVEEVVAAIGLTMRDLFADASRQFPGNVPLWANNAPKVKYP